MPRNRKTQTDIILELLQQGLKVNPQMALNRCGCFRLAAIIYDLRHKRGYNIKMNKVKSYTGNLYAEYELMPTA